LAELGQAGSASSINLPAVSTSRRTDGALFD